MNKSEKRNDILSRLKARISENKSITYKVLKKEDYELLWKIEKEFGSLSKACLEIGLTKDDLIKKFGFTRNVDKRTLSKEEMVERLEYLKSINKISTSAMRTEFDDLRLEISMKKTYGSVNNGLKALGYERSRKKATKETINERIVELQNKGVSLSYKSISSIEPSLIASVSRVYGLSWNKFLSENNLQSHKIRRDYNEIEIKNRLQTIVNKHGNLKQETVRRFDSSLCYYASSVCGGYEKMIEKFGLQDYWEPHNAINIKRGKLFELLVKEYLEEIGIDFRYNQVIGNHKEKGCIRPDFNLGDEVVDCKLSTWTPSIEETINKYTPHFSRIVIVYLRGKKSITEKYREDVVFISFKSLIRNLPDERIKHYSDKADAILNFK